MNDKRLRLLYAEENEFDRRAFEKAVQDERLPYDYVCPATMATARKLLKSERFDAVITSFFLGDGNVFDLLNEIPADTPAVIVTTVGREENAVAAIRKGAADYLIKDPEARYLKILPVTVEHAIRSTRAEHELKRSEEEFRLTFENAKDTILWADPVTRVIIKCNKAAESLLEKNRPEIVGRRQTDFHPEAKRSYYERLFEKQVAQQGIVDQEAEIVTAQGKILPVEITSSVTTVGGRAIMQSFVRDVTERKRMELRFRQTQKMEALGTLAGGIAHDFNNILYAIIGFTELAMEDAAEDSLLRSNLERVLEAANRAGDVTNQILAFSNQVEQERKPIQIGPVVKDTLKFLRAVVPATIEMRREIDEDLGTVLFDPTQMNQLLMNLCNNSAHAMREKGGVLTVSVKNFEVDSELAARHRDLIPGPHLKLTVEDTGHGMSPGVLERIFEPYFTTKQPGEGTGLGLATVHGIVMRQGGAIHCESEPGKGTRFEVLLPVIKIEPEEQIENDDGLPGGHERVLFVDDEQPIVDIARQMLQRLGYRVETRTSSIEALELFRHRPNEFDVVLTDMTMPNMTGLELAKELVAIRPELPVVLCTGFSRTVDVNGASAFGIREVISKPLLKGDMARAVRRALDRAEPSE